MKNQRPKKKTKTKRNFFKSIMNRIRDRRRKRAVTRHVYPRRLARSVAKANMKNEGYIKLNNRAKDSKSTKSLFAREWRKYV